MSTRLTSSNFQQFIRHWLYQMWLTPVAGTSKSRILWSGFFRDSHQVMAQFCSVPLACISKPGFRNLARIGSISVSAIWMGCISVPEATV
ncbi:hypothetical protein thalar_00704 [Litoreibacter arenae DSM 19593]|uniref:Uncharacterized protein n=1 Tax=Litoreibacter arenae DSM 19593 TaxID=1123360 RepID=S9S503_9RHOB|nr:hypothetical protein thalar_00704 [Litoreibacter arenae DSM 19593]